MAVKQSMMWAVTQAAMETAKAAIMAVKEEENSVNTVRPMHIIPRTSGPTLKEPTFNWKAANKSQGL